MYLSVSVANQRSTWLGQEVKVGVTRGTRWRDGAGAIAR